MYCTYLLRGGVLTSYLTEIPRATPTDLKLVHQGGGVEGVMAFGEI